MANLSTAGLVAAILGFAISVPGQRPDLRTADNAGFVPGPDEFLVPVHRAVHDSQSPDDAWWAGGAAYKVAFRDGFEFFPVLGADAPRSLPVRWRTRSIRVGGEPVADLTERETRPSPWRFELATGGVVEAYDVRPDGVEQTFVLTRRPTATGDFVVVGGIESALAFADRPARHGPIEFVDDRGRTVVTYGAALVYDALGRSAPVTTAVGDGEVRMVVPWNWLKDAAYPVTLDPLTSAVQVSSAFSSIDPVVSTAIASTSDAGASNVVIAFSRAISGRDRDIYALSMDDDWGNRRLIYQDLTTDSDFDAQVAYVAGADRWLIAMQRDVPQRSGTVVSTIRTYYHDLGNPTSNSGVAFSIVNLGGEYSRPALGGTTSQSGVHGILAYQLETTSATNGPNSEIVVVPIRASTRQYLSAWIAGDAPVGTTLDRENPTVTPVSDGSNGWIVAWDEQRRSFITDDWDIMAVRTNADAVRVGSSAELASGGARHARRPKIAGNAEAFVLAYELSESLPNAATVSVVSRRVDWPVRSGAPTVGPMRTIVDVGSAVLSAFTLRDLAFDSRTGSHWAATWTRNGTPKSAWFVRLGGSGAVVEQGALYSSRQLDGDHASVAYNSRTGTFGMLYSVGQSQSQPYHPIMARHLQYPNDAISVPYGPRCSSTRISSSQPYVGNREFAVRLGAAPAGVAATAIISLAATSIPLDAVGIPGCELVVDPAIYIIGLPTVTDGRGGASVALPLPDVPAVPADLFGQWVYIVRGANPANLLVSEGLRMQVR